MTLKEKISSLLSLANGTTGTEDTNLTDAVKTLVDGFGQGGGSSNIVVIDLGEIPTGVTTYDKFLRANPISIPFEDCFIILTVDGDRIQTQGSTTIKHTVIPVKNGNLISNSDINRNNGSYYNINITKTGMNAPNSMNHLTNYSIGIGYASHMIEDGQFKWAKTGTSYYVAPGNRVTCTIVKAKDLMVNPDDEIYQQSQLFDSIIAEFVGWLE